MTSIIIDFFILIMLLLILAIPMFLILRILASRRNAEISSKELLDLEESVKELIKHIEKTAEEKINLLDEKINEINELIDQIEKRTAYNIKQQKSVSADNREEKLNSTEDNKNMSVKERINRMAADGLSTGIIAERLDMKIGEVELILSLNKLRGKTSALGKISVQETKSNN